MPIRIPEAPRRSVAAVEATLARLLAEPQFRRRAKVAPADQSALSLSTPHQVYSVEVDELRRGGLDTAKPTSLRFIVLHGDRTIGSAETRLDERGLPGSFANMAQGAEIDGFVDGLVRAERLAQIDEDDYELRALRVNELHFQGVWLRGASGRELIVPAEPSFPPFRSGEPLDTDEFLRLVEEATRSFPETERPIEG